MILLSAQIEAISTRKDRTLSNRMGTQELTPDVAAEVLALHQLQANILIKAEPFTDIEAKALDELPVDHEERKTESAQLRAVLYRNWEQKPQGFKTFALYYAHYMETIITHYKNKLN